MNTLPLLSRLLACWLCLLAMDAFADTRLDQPIDLAPYIEYIEDPDRTLKIEDLLSGKIERPWQRNSAETFVGQNEKSRYWFRISLHFPQDIAALKPMLYLPIHPQLVYELTLWIAGDDGRFYQRQAGWNQPYQQRDVRGPRYAFPLSTTHHTATVIGWIDNRVALGTKLLPLTLLSGEQHIDAQHQVRGVMIAFYAVMAALLLYNACLWISLRQPLYGYYLVFMSTSTYMCAVSDGATQSGLWLTNPQLDTRLGVMVCPLMMLFYMIFVWEALDHLRFSSLCRKGFQVMFGIGALVFLHNSFATDWRHTSLVIQVYSSSMIVLVLATLVLAVYKRIPTAIYLLAAEVFVMVGGTTFMLTTNNVLPFNETNLWSLHGGFLAESLLLSLALADQTRRLQQSAIDNLKKYETIYNRSIEGIFQYSLKDDVSKCNPSMAILYGYPSVNAFLADQRMARLTDEATRHQLHALLIAEGKVTNFETKIIHQHTREPVWISLNMRLTMDNQERPTVVEGTVVDITDKKLKELAQREAMENLSRSDELKNEFLATMSHELRTPMNGIAGYLELLKPAEINADNRTLLNSLERCSADMLHLIDRILDFTQLLAGNLALSVEYFDFSAMLEEWATVYRQRCHAKTLGFTVIKEDNIPKMVWGDRKKLSAIINELLDNAMKYTSIGGIELVIKTLPSQKVSTLPHGVNAFVLVSVRDTGIGIAIADRPKIFKAFRQLDGAFNRKYGGLGLGLALCHQYIQLMDGTLTLLSAAGHGSRFDFIVELSATSTQAEAKIPAANHPIPRVANANILIVEDNPTNQLVLKGILKKLGHQTREAENGLKALEILEGTPFDLVLMDCQMPEMDGFEATREIRKAQGRYKNIPIIAVTANVMEGDRQRCLEAGMNDYMKKPISKDLLVEKINQWYREQAGEKMN